MKRRMKGLAGAALIAFVPAAGVAVVEPKSSLRPSTTIEVVGDREWRTDRPGAESWNSAATAGDKQMRKQAHEREKELRKREKEFRKSAEKLRKAQHEREKELRKREKELRKTAEKREKELRKAKHEREKELREHE